MMDFISQHKIVSIVVLLLLIGAAWWGFTANSAPAPVLTTTGLTSGTSTQDAELVSTLLQLQAVTLSGTILTDPGFISLQDYTTQVVTEPIGRPDPFAPLSGTAPAGTSTTTLDPNLFAPAKH